MPKLKCPICSRGVDTITNKKNKLVFQKHIGVGFWKYGQSRGNICFSSFKDILRNDLKQALEKENQLMQKLFPNKERKNA
mgnify:FL=1|jgi:hypothetical protein|tara:strand:+ start:1195 stop:1434 length:240 start_codon:yes stop_codon:yes gene_type:complete